MDTLAVKMQSTFFPVILYYGSVDTLAVGGDLFCVSTVAACFKIHISHKLEFATLWE